MKVLLLSYYFDPYPSVAAKRVSYWADNFHKYNITCDVYTATEQKKEKDNIFFIKDTGRSGLLGKIIKDPGLSWKRDILDFLQLKNIQKEYDYIIFSGGPFLHFSLQKKLKDKFNAKVILDYRDPLSNNPSMNDGFIKKLIKRFFERKFNKLADEILAVNEVCKEGMPLENKVTIIKNGFDDEKIGSTLTSNLNEFIPKGLINCGKVYPDFKLDFLFSNLTATPELNMLQIGANRETFPKIVPNNLRFKGFIEYQEMILEIKNAEIALLLTGGKKFESPTKLFDYLALNKKILIITQGTKKSGAIQGVLEDYPNVIWANNDEIEIKHGLNQLLEMEAIYYNPERFSRKASQIKLVNLMTK